MVNLPSVRLRQSATPDREFECFVHRLARRVSTFDREVLADIKYFVNKVSLPDMARVWPWARPEDGRALAGWQQIVSGPYVAFQKRVTAYACRIARKSGPTAFPTSC
jgi:hypothetical protein